MVRMGGEFGEGVDRNIALGLIESCNWKNLGDENIIGHDWLVRKNRDA
jgi:hypothetical protein